MERALSQVPSFILQCLGWDERRADRLSWNDSRYHSIEELNWSGPSDGELDASRGSGQSGARAIGAWRTETHGPAMLASSLPALTGRSACSTRHIDVEAR
jgi:hypothetical protein